LRFAAPAPSLDAERAAWSAGARAVAGLDEAGRGALAGPVVAAAVVLPDDAARALAALAGVRDSKQLDREARARLLPEIVATAAGVGIGAVDPTLIDALGIARAGDLAMLRALSALPCAADFLLVDGFHLRLSHLPQRAVVRGDQSVLSIAAASIVAKVHRDAWMVRLGFEVPGYDFDRHKGYGTAAHLRALRERGATVHHRLSWAPIARSGRNGAAQPALPGGADQPALPGGGGPG
jgi:ribonuclease HII